MQLVSLGPYSRGLPSLSASSACGGAPWHCYWSPLPLHQQWPVLLPLQWQTLEQRRLQLQTLILHTAGRLRHNG